MNSKQDLFTAIGTAGQLGDYVMREFARVDPDDEPRIDPDSLADWDPFEGREELDALLLARFSGRQDG